MRFESRDMLVGNMQAKPVASNSAFHAGLFSPSISLSARASQFTAVYSLAASQIHPNKIACIVGNSEVAKIPKTFPRHTLQSSHSGCRGG